MMSPGDGIAIAGVCAVIIGAIAKFTLKKKPETNGFHKIFVSKELCDTKVKAFSESLTRIEAQLAGIDKFLREKGGKIG